MARSKSSDHSSIRPKVFATQEEILRAIVKLQGRIAQVEELGREGIPYRDALRVTAEVQIKETIREIFGEHSPEFRVHQHHRIKSHDEEDLAETCAMLEGLIENLEEKRRSLLGGGVPGARSGQARERAADPSPVKPPPPARPPTASQPQPPVSIQSGRPFKLVTETTTPSPAARAMASSTIPGQAPRTADPLERIRHICLHFHAIVRQMRQRHDARPTLDVEDVHDVRDLLHALLCLEFEDIRTEQVAPTYAGGQGRTDLLIERERIAVTAKKTRQGFGAKEIADEVTLDVQRYAAHPDCATVFCFVYDPEGRIGNPRKLESELKSERDGRSLVVLIAPK
jgi:HD superfamily phosphodiesterase